MPQIKCAACGTECFSVKTMHDPLGKYCSNCAPQMPGARTMSSGLTFVPDHRALREAVALAVLKCTPELPAADVVPTCERILDYIINGNK